MGFDGWGEDALEFWEGLEVDNSKAYWASHQGVYKAKVLAPMTALLAELEPEFGAGRLFRPYRDVRFSPDKTPYKTQLGAMVGDTGYVHISARGLMTAGGYYAFAPDQLARYRRAVLEDLPGDELVRLTSTARGQGLWVDGISRLATAPRGVAKDHPRIELLRLKGLVVGREFEVEGWLETPEARERIAEVLRQAAPVGEWLRRHVGPTELERERPGAR